VTPGETVTPLPLSVSDSAVGSVGSGVHSAGMSGQHLVAPTIRLSPVRVSHWS
jgi:hypothetical protein